MSEPILTAATVIELHKACWCGQNADDVTEVEAVKHKFYYNKASIGENRERIHELLKELPEQFQQAKGGGWSFMNACMDCHDNQWADLHDTMELLFALGLAAGLVSMPLPREMWVGLPGGMPYFTILTEIPDDPVR